MPFVLRKIRKAKWYKHEAVHWLPEGELQADALSDLATKDNELSVWRVNDDRSNLEDVIAALGASSSVVSNLDYALFNQDALVQIDVRMKVTKGTTIDERVNTSWHSDLVELSASKLIDVARAILAKGEITRVPEKKVLELITSAVASGRIDSARLDERIRAKIDEVRPH